MSDKCDVQIYIDGKWHNAGTVKLLGDRRNGIGAKTRFEYSPDYLDRMQDHLEDATYWAISCRYPVSYQLFDEQSWPAFLLDIVPSGAARRGWENILKLNNNPSSDWDLLIKGGGNPPGHLRIAQAVSTEAISGEHPGFEYNDIISRREEFMVYARDTGAPVSGSAGAGGDAPKFLLREGLNGRWHADGVLPDDETKRHMLVKFPRGSRTTTDCMILKAEKSYYDIAEAFGAQIHRPLVWDNDCLFIERFDRIQAKDGSLVRLGFESICSIAGVAQFGAQIPLDEMAHIIHSSSSAPHEDLKEFVRRDILNVALGNTDNHPTNIAMIKYPDGKIRLAPLFDFAPMFLDPSGIPRVCKWPVEEGLGYPVWKKVAEILRLTNLVDDQFSDWLKSQVEPVRSLPSLMRKFGTPAEVVTRCEEKIATVAQMLSEI